MFCVYIIQNEQGRRYIGSCKDITTRLTSHNRNWADATKGRGPFKLMYKEEFLTRGEARKRENELKRYKGNGTFKRMLKQCTSPSSSPA